MATNRTICAYSSIAENLGSKDSTFTFQSDTEYRLCTGCTVNRFHPASHINWGWSYVSLLVLFCSCTCWCEAITQCMQWSFQFYPFSLPILPTTSLVNTTVAKKICCLQFVRRPLILRECGWRREEALCYLQHVENFHNQWVKHMQTVNYILFWKCFQSWVVFSLQINYTEQYYHFQSQSRQTCLHTSCYSYFSLLLQVDTHDFMCKLAAAKWPVCHQICILHANLANTSFHTSTH